MALNYDHCPCLFYNQFLLFFRVLNVSNFVTIPHIMLLKFGDAIFAMILCHRLPSEFCQYFSTNLLHLMYGSILLFLEYAWFCGTSVYTSEVIFFSMVAACFFYMLHSVYWFLHATGCRVKLKAKTETEYRWI